MAEYDFSLLCPSKLDLPPSSQALAPWGLVVPRKISGGPGWRAAARGAGALPGGGRRRARRAVQPELLLPHETGASARRGLPPKARTLGFR